MKIRAVIIEDEENIRELLKQNIAKHLSEIVEIVGEADDVTPAIRLVEEEEPDLLFMDVQLKRGTGFDILEKVKEYEFDVIFLTAYDEYAIKAFDFSAFGYLLKPVRVRDLVRVTEQLHQRLQKIRTETSKRIKVLINNYSDEDGKLKRLVIGNNEGFTIVVIKDILRLESDNNYTWFILTSGDRLITSTTIKEYEMLLYDYGFYRIHKRHIVNLLHVTSYKKGDVGKVILSDKTELPVARNRKQGFQRKIF